MSGQCHAPASILLKEKPSIYCTGGWVGPTAGLDRCGKPHPHQDSFHTVARGLLISFKTSMNKTRSQNGYNRVEYPTINFIYNHNSNPKKVCTQFVRSRQSKQLVRMVPFCSLRKQKMLHINVHKQYGLQEKLHSSVHKMLHISVHERYTVKHFKLFVLCILSTYGMKTNWCHYLNFIYILPDLYMFRAHRPIFRRVRTVVHTTIGS